jgi:hypothetical protein
VIPCSWSVACDACPGWADYPTATQDSALWLASTYLWAATGRQYGACPVTIRPAQGRGQPVAYQDFPLYPGQASSGPTGPFLFAGQWFNQACATACCRTACALVLRGPVAAVDEVLIDGEEVSPSLYRVDVSGGVYLLVREDGTCWPSCQNMSAPAGDPDTFAVTYQLGRALPEGLVIATALLACEYAKSIAGGVCRLPTSMTRLSRQGVEVEVATPNPASEDTGIREIDSVVWALNPSRRQRPPLLLSPDLPEWCDRMTVIPAGGS